MKSQLLIVAAGLGRRLGKDGPKALVPLCGKPIVVHTLERFAALGLLDDAVIVYPPSHKEVFAAILDGEFPEVKFTWVAGGEERQDSVSRGLRALNGDTELVVIHDAARPFPAEEAVQACIEEAAEYGAATVAVRCTDTILQASTAGYLELTPDRAAMWSCKTPQVFHVDIIRAAHEGATLLCTDDASLVRANGTPVRLVEGSPLNIKITTPLDLALAEYIIEKKLWTYSKIRKASPSGTNNEH